MHICAKETPQQDSVIEKRRGNHATLSSVPRPREPAAAAAGMSDAARNAFNTQLTSVMESLLTAAVCEITKIFEGSLSDSRVEIARSREEVILLKRQLEVLEERLQEVTAVGGTGTGLTFDLGGTGMGLTFDPGSFALSPDAGPGVPLLLPDLLTRGGDPTHGEECGQASRVKEDVDVTELESVTFSQEGAEISIVIKEESLEQDPGPLNVEPRGPEALGPWVPLPGAEGVKGEDAVLEAAAGRKPNPPQNPELLVGLLMAKPRTKYPNRFSAPRPGSGGQDRACGGALGVRSSGFLPVAPGNHADVAISTAYQCRPLAGNSEVTALTVCTKTTRRPSGPSLYPAGVTPYPAPPVLQGFSGPHLPEAHAQGPAGEKPYPCAQCSKAFVSPSHLNVHMRVHTGERPYCCMQCGKRFAHNGNLRAHQRQVHLGKRPYPCPECGKRFSKRGNLRTHLQQVHQGKRPYPCTHCGKAYFSLRDLRTHQAVHAAE